MSQVQNLLDMFLNNRKDVQAKGKAPESKSQAAAGAKGAQNLLSPGIGGQGQCRRPRAQILPRQDRGKPRQAGRQERQLRSPEQGSRSQALPPNAH